MKIHTTDKKRQAVNSVEVKTKQKEKNMYVDGTSNEYFKHV